MYKYTLEVYKSFGFLIILSHLNYISLARQCPVSSERERSYLGKEGTSEKNGFIAFGQDKDKLYEILTKLSKFYEQRKYKTIGIIDV